MYSNDKHCFNIVKYFIFSSTRKCTFRNYIRIGAFVLTFGMVVTLIFKYVPYASKHICLNGCELFRLTIITCIKEEMCTHHQGTDTYL